MRIISGKYRGKQLKTLEGSNTRPTTSRVKESIFNILQFDIPNANVLDLFAGSGQMGAECLSRGASFVDLVDNNSDAIKIIKQNLQNFDKNFNITQSDYDTFIKNCNKKYDIIILDPPYQKNLINLALILIKDFNILNSCGIILCESSVNDVIESNNFSINKTYKYGSTNISVIREK